MHLGKGTLAVGAIAVGVAGLLFGSGVASRAAGLGPYRMMSYLLGSTRRSATPLGGWGMMGGAAGPTAPGSGAYPSGMMGGGYGMTGGYFEGGSSPSTSGSGDLSPSTGAGAATKLPAGATVDRGQRVITFRGSTVRFAAVAGPRGGPELGFEIAGMINPEVVVPRGARITVKVINEGGAPHDFAVASAVGAAPAFQGAESAMLDPAAGASPPSTNVTFVAASAGTYVYECTVQGHAQGGMQGVFKIQP
jgi:hypothetical protein